MTKLLFLIFRTFLALTAIVLVSNHVDGKSDTTSIINKLADKAWIYAKKEVKISGGLSASSTFYYSEGISARRDPYYWVISGNIGIRYKEFSIPFSVNFSSQNSGYTRPQPFNQIGLSPKYKFITFHLGYRNINFSEFTLAGNIFLGAGIELNKENFPLKIIVLGGRFAKAFKPEDVNSNLAKSYPSYERWGYGTKITLEKDNKSLSFILFKARDNPSSVPDSLATSLGIKPAENLVVGTTAKLPIGKSINFSGEYAISSFNPDIRLPEYKLDEYSYANNLGGLFTPRVNSQYNSAFLGSLDYTYKIVRVNTTYRRIGPDYKTLGSTFLNNDFEDITLGISWQMLKNRLSVSTNGGVQRNNLSGKQLSELLRIVGSVNLSFQLNQKTNLTANYSNYNSSTQLTAFVFNSTNDVRPDSLLYLQVTNSAGFGMNYKIGSDKSRKMLNANINFQDARDNKKSNTQFYNINTGYSTMITEYKLNINSGLNYSANINPKAKIENFGPVFTISRPVVKDKIKVSFTTSFLNTFTNGNFTGNIFNNRLSANYTWRKRHSFTSDLVYLMRETQQSGVAKSFKEVRFGLNYGWSF